MIEIYRKPCGLFMTFPAGLTEAIAMGIFMAAVTV
jgi:hypothetical protein